MTQILKKTNSLLHFTSILILISLLLFSSSPSSLGVESAKILSVAFFSSKSHKLTYEPLLNELASRGHHVTVVSPVISGGIPKPNMKEILTIDVEEGMKNMLNFFDLRDKGLPISQFSMCMNRFKELCRKTYQLPKVQALLTQKFDLVILQPIFNECASGFIYKLNTSIVLVSPFGVPSWISNLFGNPSPLSFVPNMFSGFSDKMSLVQRAINIYTELSYTLNQNWVFKPSMEKIYREELNDVNIPSSDQVLANASLILSNSHFSLNNPRPFLPDIIEVGGMHCKPPSLLPKDLEEFINTSKDGFIYFSMGSALKGSLWPEKYRLEFIKAFRQLKVNVLWKWETNETMSDLPPNVKLSKWFPQQDLLGHSKIKLFITHGGLGGLAETIYHGVPIIGIPIFGDQFMNMKHAEINNIGLTLEFTELNEENISGAINKILSNSKYIDNAKSLSKIYKDQPEKPLDRAIFWIEYIIRHKGAPKLRSPARDLSFLQYHSFDIMIIFLIVLSLIIGVLIHFILSMLIKLITKMKGQGKKDFHKKNNGPSQLSSSKKNK